MIKYDYTQILVSTDGISCATLGTRYALIGGKYGALTLYDACAQEEELPAVRTFATASHLQRIHAVALSPDETLAFCASMAHDRAVFCFDTESGTLVRSFSTGGRLASALAVHADGKTLFVAADDALYCYEIDTGRGLFCVEDGEALFGGLCLSDDALFATGLFSGVREYAPDTGALRMVYEAQSECESPVYDDKSGWLYAVGMHKGILHAMIWQRGKAQSTDRLSCGAPTRLAILPQNGALLVLDGILDGVGQYDAASGAQLCEYDLCFLSGIASMVLSPDGQRMLAGNQTGLLLFLLSLDPDKIEPKKPFPLRNRWKLSDEDWCALMLCLEQGDQAGVDALILHAIDRPPARLVDMAARLWRDYEAALRAQPVIAFTCEESSDNAYGVREQIVIFRYYDAIHDQDVVCHGRASLGNGHKGCEALYHAILSLSTRSRVMVEWETYDFDVPNIIYVDSYIFDGTPCPRCHKPVLYNRWEFDIDGEDVCFTLDFQENTYFSKTVPYEALRLAALRDLREVRDYPEGVAARETQRTSLKKGGRA